mmetsp:Transcript_47768/g.136628  ORF Transcript_47768/g.136628 Transcript_47768/m.136628 type:complete len:314 (-) Transcript_47768:969-1910(-)
MNCSVLISCSSLIPLVVADVLQARGSIKVALLWAHLVHESQGRLVLAALALPADLLHLLARIELFAIEVADWVRVDIFRGSVRIFLAEESKRALYALLVALHVLDAVPEVAPNTFVCVFVVLLHVGIVVPVPVAIAHVVEVADVHAARILVEKCAVVTSIRSANAGPLFRQAVPHTTLIEARETLGGHGERVVPKIVAANEVAQPGVVVPATGDAVDGPRPSALARVVREPDPEVEAPLVQCLGRCGLHFHTDDALDPKLARLERDHLVVQVPHHSSEVPGVDTPPWVVNVTLRAVHVIRENWDHGHRQIRAI